MARYNLPIEAESLLNGLVNLSKYSGVRFDTCIHVYGILYELGLEVIKERDTKKKKPVLTLVKDDDNE